MKFPARNLALALLALTTAILGVLSSRQRSKLRELEQTLTSVTAERDAAVRQAAEAGRLAVERFPDQPPSPVPSVATGGPVATFRPVVAGAATMIDNPRMQQAMAASMKSSLDMRYGSLFRQLRLSPGDLDKLKDLLVERQMSTMDVMRAAQTQGLNPAANSEQLSALAASIQGEIDSEIRTLIGNEAFSRYEDFNQNSGAYALLDQIERRLGYTNAPLQAGQTDALMRIIHETAKPVETPFPPRAAGMAFQVTAGSGPLVTMLGPGGPQPQITEQTIAAAQAVLTPPQIEALNQVLGEQQNQLATFQFATGAATPGVQTTLQGVPVPTPLPPER